MRTENLPIRTANLALRTRDVAIENHLTNSRTLVGQRTELASFLEYGDVRISTKRSTDV